MSFDGIKACELEMKPAWDNPSDTSKESNGFERPSAATNPSPFIQKKRRAEAHFVPDLSASLRAT